MRLLPSLFERAQRVRKGVTASEVVYEEDRLKVLHYVSEDKAAFIARRWFSFMRSSTGPTFLT